MIYEQDAVRRLYKRLLAFYPRSFREQLAESMEQTFNDLWMEKRRAKEELYGFVLWTFVETSIGIFREHLLLISPGDLMQTILKTIGSPALISLLLILPFMIMEVVNRRNFDEDFPFFLFFFMWLNLFAISLILLPIVRSRRTANQDMANPIPRQRNIPFTNPKSAAMLSISLILSFVLVFLLDYVGWVPLNYLVNGPNPEQPYLPGLFISLALFSIPVAAAIVACRPIVSTLQTGGSLFAHPIHLIIVVVILTLLAFSWGSWVIDQWPCFMGVPNCD